MVFAKLSTQEKDAFFGLLDEYFESRPELFKQHDGQGGISTAAAASVVQRALSANPTSSGGAHVKSNNPYGAALTTANEANVAQAVTAGRVAAASLAFSQGGAGRGAGVGGLFSHAATAAANQGQGQGPGDAPTLPRRGTPGAEVDKLVTRKTGMLSALKKQPPPSVAVPPAFAAPKSTFGPPPVRRATSDTNTTATATATAGVAPRTGAAPARVEEAARGEWAEVLYDYSSEDPGDLGIEAGSRVLVTAKSSEDWWSGKVEGQGREGLFPASYVKLL